MNRLLTFFALALTIALTLPGQAQAQSKGAADSNTAAYELFSAGDYQGAATAYDKLIKDYPTDVVIPIAQVQLAFSYYFLGQFDQALAILAKAQTGPPLPADLKLTIDGLIPQILVGKGAAMPLTDPKRTAAFEEAIKKFSDFITANPQAKDLENVIFSRAVAAYQIKKYDDVVKDLELNIQRFPQSGTIATSKNLLARTLALQGTLELNKHDDAKKPAAFALYKRAVDYLREIINNKQDIALINESNFLLGEILFNQANFTPEAERPPLYKQAMEAYRAVAPKDQIIEWQKEVIKGFPELKRKALLANNAEMRKQLDKDNERELKKLGELEAKPDQVATAMLKMGEIFFQQLQINSARVLLQHVSPFLDSEDEAKRALYFVTMTYAMQNAADSAAASYKAFQAKYKGDPLADNLPVTLGNMYFGLNNLPEATKYYDESLALYPKGRFAGLSVVKKAQIESKTGNYEAASKTFKDFLASNPPPEIGVEAQSGLAGIYKDTKKWDDAIAAYKVLTEKYPSTPQALEGEYWIAISTQQKGDHAAAIPLLDAFVKAHPDYPNSPPALYFKGASQLQLKQVEEAITTFGEVADKYPASQPAPFTYFQRANLRGPTTDAAVALMQQFIEKYPKDDKVFNAYEIIAQAASANQKTDDAVAAYREYAQKYPESPQAGEALYKAANLQIAKAESMGRYGALNEEERAKWRPYIDGTISSIEELVQKYPESPSLAPALETLLKAQSLKVAGELMKEEEVQAYFQKLADNAGSPNAKSKILFTLATYVAKQDEAKALAIMTQAYNPDVMYSPESLDFFGLALVDQKKYTEAAAVFENLAKQYPNPVGVAPTSAPALIQNAQAIALFGKGSIAQAQGQVAEAGKIFEQLKALYPWSSKVLEANYGIAALYKDQKKYDEALQLLAGIVRAPTVTSKLGADCMLLGGYIMLEKMKDATEPKQKAELQANAIDYFIKIAQLYSAEPKQAAEGLWMGSQLLEEQANASADAKFKAQQLNRAKLFYQQLIKDYPNSENIAKAQARLAALPK